MIADWYVFYIKIYPYHNVHSIILVRFTGLFREIILITLT